MRWIKCQKSQCQEFSLFLARSNFNKTDVETKLQGSQLTKFNIVRMLASLLPVLEVKGSNLSSVTGYPEYFH